MARKRSIVISLLVIGVVAALIAAATTATFSDQVTSSGNTFTAGTLFLAVDGGANGDCSTGPNRNATPTATPGNFGSDATGVDGGVNAAGDTGCEIGTITFTVGAGNKGTQSNMVPGDTYTKDLTITNKGSITGTLQAMTPTVTTNNETGCPGTNFTVTGLPGSDTTLTANQSITPTATVTFAAAAGNACQGVTATVTLTFHLVQA